MVRIVSPFSEKEEVLPLIEAGANELYCGYLSPEWVQRYTNLEFERKGGLGSNLSKLEDLKKAVQLAHGKNVPVYLTLNGLYVNKQYPLLLKIVKQLNRLALDGYIVADIGFLLTLRQKGFKKQIHISTGATVFNSESANFYRDLGASRIILDRQITLKSIDSLSRRHPDIAFEVFILNTLCAYIDGFCTFTHTYGWEAQEEISKKGWGKDERLFIVTAYDSKTQDACCLPYLVEGLDDISGKKIDSNKIRPTFYKQLIDGVECGACALYDIARTRVSLVKIVGRQLSSKVRLESTKFIRSCLDILENNKDITRPDFIAKVQALYRKFFKYNKTCQGNNCYHPELLAKNFN